jgi:hypothetical protein
MSPIVIDLVDRSITQKAVTDVFELKGFITFIPGEGLFIGKWRVAKPKQLRNCGYSLKQGVIISVLAQVVHPGFIDIRILRRVEEDNRKLGDMRNNPTWRRKQPHLVKKIDQFYKERDRLTLKTGIIHHVDHIHLVNHPLLCGLTVPANLQVITAAQNLQKGNRIIGQ